MLGLSDAMEALCVCAFVPDPPESIRGPALNWFTVFLEFESGDLLL